MSRTSPQPGSEAQAGFTLIEVLVGLVLSASILAGLASLTNSVGRGWDSAARKLSRQEITGNGLAIAAGDISRIQRIADRSLAPPAFLFRGAPSSMTFVMSERPASGARGLYWINLNVRDTGSGKALVRARAPFNTKAQPGTNVDWSDEVVLLDGGFSFAFSYRAGRGETESWLSDWPERDALPGLVRIQMTDSRTGTEAYPAMIVALKIGAEAACVDIKEPSCTMTTDGKILSEAK